MLNKFRAAAHHTYLRLVLAFAAGAMTALAFAPYSYWPLYLIAMAFALHQSAGLSGKTGHAILVKLWLRLFCYRH